MRGEIGKDLNNLAKHLQKKLSGGSSRSGGGTSPALYNELCLRTRVNPRKLSDNKRPRPLADSEWFQIMKQRYQAARSTLVEKSAAMEEIKEVAGSMYGGGCSWSSLGSAVTTISSMLTEASLSDAELEAAAKKRTPKSGAGKATGENILKVFLDVLESHALSRWWEKDQYTDANRPQLITVCLKDQPHPTISLEYTVDGKANLKNQPLDASTVHYRDISLKGHLSVETASLSHIARSLSERYHFLLDDEHKWSRYLSKLQRLMKESAQDAKQRAIERQNRPAAPEVVNSAKEEPPEETGPKKGDLGALFRDGASALKDVDLQDADELTVKEYKAKMDDGFNQNKLRPGDKGYTYDIRVDVKPTKSSGWDSDSDE